MDAYPLDKNGPPLFPISSEDWWVKVLGMLQHNWALIETHKDSVTVYFFHDEGITRGFLKGYTSGCEQADSRERLVVFLFLIIYLILYSIRTT